MRVSLGKVTGYSTAERQKLDQATQQMANVLNSKEFRDAVLSAEFDGKPGFASDDRSPQEVYAAIRAAKRNQILHSSGRKEIQNRGKQNHRRYACANGDGVYCRRIHGRYLIYQRCRGPIQCTVSHFW